MRFLPRYSIRYLLVATFVIALLIAIPVQRAAKQRIGKAWVTAQRGQVIYAYRTESENNTKSSKPAMRVPSFVVNALGIDFFNPIRGVMLDCEEVTDLKPIENLQSLKDILINIEVSEDLDFSPLAKLPKLEAVLISEHAGFSSQQIESLRRLIPKAKIVFLR
jgi:hypothetical protein